MRLGIHEIFEKVSKASKLEERIEILRKNDNPVLRHIFKLAYTKGVKWLLPDGKPPYKLNEFPDQETNLYSQWKRFYLFFPGGNDNVNQIKRELIFIQILEGIHPKDAQIICDLKDGKITYKNINRQLVESAFPDIFNDYSKEQLK